MAREIVKPLSGARGPLLTVSVAPHWHCGRTVSGMMLETLLALAPAAIMAVTRFGLPAARVMALSCVVAVLAEAACQRWMGRRVRVDDFSAMATGLLFAFLLPAAAPWWLVAAGSAVSVLLGKMIFGGLGGVLCAPVLGWTALRISWPEAMSVDVTMLSYEFTYPLTQLKYLGVEAIGRYDLWHLLLGRQLGGLGAVQGLALLAGGAFLLLRRRLRPDIPLAFLAGVFCTALVYRLIDPSAHAAPLFHLATGGVLLGAFFLAPDPGSSPSAHLPMVLYGLIAGAFVVVIRVYGQYPDGVPFAILLANLLTPLLDRLRPRPWGAARKGGGR
jgi:electron transport complex protein RnfD